MTLKKKWVNSDYLLKTNIKNKMKRNIWNGDCYQAYLQHTILGVNNGLDKIKGYLDNCLVEFNGEYEHFNNPSFQYGYRPYTQEEFINKIKTFEEFIESVNESKFDYQVYHNTYSSAVDTALEHARSKGYEVVQDDVWNQISIGPKKPSEGKTNKAIIGLLKDGKPQRKTLSIQIYGMGNRYELNAYIA